MRKAILIMGPPGAGKGTQADLIAHEFNLIHFDTGRYIEDLVKEGRIAKEKRGFKRGKLTDPHWVLKEVKNRTKQIADAGFGVILSGSPRSPLEAFGDQKQEGLIPYLYKLYGRKNLFIFKLEIPPRVSISRNSKRMVCSVCWKPHLLGSSLKRCPFCGGKLIKRIQDKPEVIKVRLEEYKSRTEPVFTELKNRGFKVHQIDGTPKPEVIFKSMARRIRYDSSNKNS